MSNSSIFKASAKSVVRAIGILLAALTIAGCNLEDDQPGFEELEIDNAATDFDPEAFTMYYGVTVMSLDGGAVDSVTAELYLRSELDDTTTTDSLVELVSLRDDGEEGDIIPADDVFSRPNPAPFARGTVSEALVIYRAYINSVEYTLRDSLTVGLPVLSDIVLQFFKIDNEIFCSVLFSSPTDTPVPDTIWAEFRSATGVVADSAAPGTLLDTRELFDNQLGGDVTADDSIYSRLFPSPFDEPITGKMNVLFVVFVDGVIYTATDTLKMLNQRPVIDSVAMETTVMKPTGELLIKDWIYVDVSDPDGVDDLKSVTFQIVKPDGTLGVGNDGSTVFYLFDDGKDTSPYGIFNDVAPGDGRYSGGVSFSAANDSGTYQFRFVAMDYSNETSDTATVDVELE